MSPRPARIAGPMAALLASTLLLAGCSDDGDDPAHQPGSAPLSADTASTPPPSSTTPSTAGTLDADTFVPAVADALRDAGSLRATLTVSGGLTRDIPITDTTQLAAGLATLGTPERFAYVGSEQVDGVIAGHYRVGIDLAAILGSVQIPDAYRSLVPDTLDADVWLDDRNRPVRLTAEPAVGGTTASLELAVEYDVSAP